MSEFDGYRANYQDGIDRAIAFAGKSQDYYTKFKADLLIDLFRRQFGSIPLDVLDVGCGNGAIHPHLLSSGLALKLTGVEVAARFVDLARAANPDVRYDVYDGKRLPYGAARFDAVIAICVMHHIPPPEWIDFVRELQRVVRPGGMIAAIEHNPFNPLTVHVVRTCEFDRNAVMVKPGRLKELLRTANLEDVGVRFFQFTSADGLLFRRVDRLLGWLPLGAQYLAFGRVPG